MNVEIKNSQTAELRKVSTSSRFGAGLNRLRALAADMDELRAAFDTLETLGGASIGKSMARMRREMDDFEPTITVLGQVKAGKTALVNAMAGWSDMLPSDVNPWTSVVTSLHLKPGEERSENGAKFRFMTDAEWDRLLSKGGRIGELASRAGAESELQKISEQIEMVRERARRRLGKKFEMLIGQEHEYGYFDKNLLEKYICLGDAFELDEEMPADAEQGRFAEILRSADLYLNSVMVPCNLCLRDTPGVNDTFMMREQITVQAIRDSRICVVVLSANQALTSVDMGLIRLISNLKSRNIVIFVNRIDELSEPARQVPEIKASIEKTLAQHNAPEGIEIIFGSAYWANVALSGDIEAMSRSSEGALLQWAEHAMTAHSQSDSGKDMVWGLSGVPGLFAALSERIDEDLGRPFLQKLSSNAITIVTSRQAAGKIKVDSANAAQSNPEVALQSLKTVSNRHTEALREDLSILIEEFRGRTNRAHAQFIERATQSLITHLEQFGPKAGWKYDPAGLRILMRSAYTVLGKSVQKMSEERFESALGDIAEIYASAFGSAAEGVQLAMPETPTVPPPVTIGQTIALDFNDGWWMSWWQRMRGYEAFAGKFRQLIADETQDFMTQLQTVQTDEFYQKVIASLSEFFDQQSEGLSEILAGSEEGAEMEDLIKNSAQANGADVLEQLLKTFEKFTIEQGKS
ncbi:MAG: dynamin family protein [Pseudomonadota bacterium]